MENNETTNQNINNNLSINKQIFVERPVGKITVGKLIVICSFINIAILFLLFFFSGLVCLHVFANNSGFYKLDEDQNNIHLNSSGITIIVFDCIFIITSLILQIYIWKYKISLKKSFWKKIFWALILITFLFMIFGISDTNTAPWIYVLNSKKDYVKSGGWWLILGIFIMVLIYLLIVLLSNIPPNKVKNKMSKLVTKDKNKQNEQVTNND